ncbi:MAG: hypothetical protein EOP06_03935 [Proteobacteria bacterium]|nr:MAG: hypothetical protein EOP06_03935 [Pseudomonadota bacterium]
MKLKGILDFSLGNFLCLRGFAPMGVLQDISVPPADIQRVPKDARLKEVGDYLRKGDLVFFPEVILCACLHDEDVTSDIAAEFFEKVKIGQSFKRGSFAQGVQIQSAVSTSRGDDDIRAVKFFQTATLSFRGALTQRFARLDGNHRLAASKEQSVRDRVTPFCLILCQNQVEFRRFSRSLFHNINYKQVPLTMEHNLKLILEDEDLFPDGLLQNDPSFGWPYYLARKLHGKLDFELLPNLVPFLHDEPRSFLLQQFEFLVSCGVLSNNEHAIKRFKEALGKVNSLFDASPALKDSRNRGLLASLVYYELKKDSPAASFVSWVLHNHLQLIEKSNSADFIAIFDKVLESRKRTIFVSMPFGKEKPADHYAIIERVAKAVSDEHGLKPPLKVQRVDWFHDGTSYEINDKIIEMMSDCGLFIGNLTHCNPNVYHEIGFTMGKAKAQGDDVANMLLFLDESVEEDKDKFVGFNLRGIKQLRFTQPEVGFAPALKENLERFFKISP